MRMKKFEQRGYLAPEIEVNEIKVEQGFSGSMLEDPIEKDKQYW